MGLTESHFNYALCIKDYALIYAIVSLKSFIIWAN
jgi:hypothetical protein